MKGMELAERFWREQGRESFWKAFPEEMKTAAVGLAGEGSECFGYDDEISRDHDFGAGFCIWLPEEVFAASGERMQRHYQSLGDFFEGFPVKPAGMAGRDRVGVMALKEFLARFIGKEQPPASPIRWLMIPEDKLAMAVNGRVFEDPTGEFTELRRILREECPEDVRRQRIACRAALMAQSGQYNYGRCMWRGDSVAAAQAQAIFVKQTISMVHLLNHAYTPYYKWAYRSCRELPILGKETAELLQRLADCPRQRQVWEQIHGADWNPYVNREDEKVCIIEEICRWILEELRRQGLTDLKDEFLEPHAWEIKKHIEDPTIRALHVMEG